MSGHAVDKLAIASYVTDDLPQRKRTELETHLRECGVCRAYYEQLVRERENFLDRFPFEQSTPSRPHNVVSFPVPSRLYAIAACFLVLLTGVWIYYASQKPDTMRIKGGSDIRVVVQGIDGTIEERSSHIYYPGERIQFIYSCADRNNFMLFGLDEKGTLTTYLPAKGDNSMTLTKGADIPLPHSILLDDYIGNELFIAVFSAQQLSVSNMKQYIMKQYTDAGTVDTIRFKKTNNFIISSILITKQIREK